MLTDIDRATPEQLAAALGQRIEEVRLSRDTSQADLAAEAGVSLRTITRLARGENVSLDSFLRVVRALGLAEALFAALPDPSVRPVDLVQRRARPRQRASGKRKPTGAWTWGDGGENG